MPSEEETAQLRESYEEQIKQELMELANYKKALEEEFAGRSLDDPLVAKDAKDKIVELVPDAAKNLKWLINHADSEAIRKDISKWVMDLAIKQHEKAAGEDAISQLLKELNSPVERPTHNNNA